jgi:hypothetical protein
VSEIEITLVEVFQSRYRGDAHVREVWNGDPGFNTDGRVILGSSQRPECCPVPGIGIIDKVDLAILRGRLTTSQEVPATDQNPVALPCELSGNVYKDFRVQSVSNQLHVVKFSCRKVSLITQGVRSACDVLSLRSPYVITGI